MTFDRDSGTFTIKFEDMDALNYNAPRAGGAYLSGSALEEYIQSLHPENRESLNTEATYEQYMALLASHAPQGDPQGVTGGEEIDSKVAEYKQSIGWVDPAVDHSVGIEGMVLTPLPFGN